MEILYLALHHHRFGTSALLFRNRTGEPPMESVVEQFGDDFEPDRNEWIEVIPVTITNLSPKE